MSEETWYKLIATAVVVGFIAFVLWLVIYRPEFSSGVYYDNRSTTQRQCEENRGVYTKGFFSEGCTFPPVYPKQ